MAHSQQVHRPPLRPVLESYVTVTAAAYTARAGDRVIGVNRAGAVTVTLPTAQLRPGRCYTVKDESGAAATNNITMATEGAETIDGAATDTISQNYGSKTYYSDGSNWFTVPLLAVGSHTLASHSARAHTDLTGVGANDHHAQDHATRHQPAGADAMAVDAAVGTGSLRTLGAGAQQAAAGDHTHAAGGADKSALVYHSANQSIANDTTTILAFDTEEFDTDTIHDPSTNNSRLTCKTAGKYLVGANVSFDTNGAGRRWVQLLKNGVDLVQTEVPPSGAAQTRFATSTLVDLVVNDYVEVKVYQNSGAALNVLATRTATNFYMTKVLG